VKRTIPAEQQQNDTMNPERAAKRIHDACVRLGAFQPSELLRWLAADILAGFGIPPQQQPPEETWAWLREVSGGYAGAVAENPFADILGIAYQMLGSNGHRSALGQFFTPGPLCTFMAQILGVDKPRARSSDLDLLRMCEPSCGSGALVLAFMQQVVERDGSSGLRAWSITGIDLDPLCAQLCAVQVLSNLYVQRLELGELVIYRGNALGGAEDLGVVVHTTVHDLTPDLVIPAMHPSRLAALRAAAVGSSTAEQHRAGRELVTHVTARAPGQGAAAPSAGHAAEHAQVDLFAD